MGSLLYVNESHITFLHKSGIEKTECVNPCQKWNCYKKWCALIPVVILLNVLLQTLQHTTMVNVCCD
jgi:hypothetical protein